MTSKSFRGLLSANELNVVGYGDSSQVDLLIRRSDRAITSTGIAIALSDAPALALAILEAAGHGKASDSSRLMQAFDLIELHVNEQERITAEAKEQAELEAEALELANSAVLVVGNPPYPSIGHMSDTSLRKWLAVARKAREIGAEK